MEIKGVVHCFFEQSGTFKNEFKKLGYEAFDYDIQNNFQETDFVIDLFSEIEKAYDNKESIFDKITGDDLIIAFFPCIKFCNIAEYNQRSAQEKWRRDGMDIHRIYELLKKESDERYKLYQLCLKMHAVVEFRGFRMIMENPWNELNYTNHFWFKRVTLIDRDRTRRGDYFHKPTGYWFTGCEPTYGQTFQPTPQKDIVLTGVRMTSADMHKQKHKIAAGSSKSGLCSEERSMISPTYARNFICDKILGISQQ